MKTYEQAQTEPRAGDHVIIMKGAGEGGYVIDPEPGWVWVWLREGCVPVLVETKALLFEREWDGDGS